MKRTTHRSSAGKKLYAVRSAEGQFKDIQTFERSHRADLAKTSKAEVETRAKKAAKAAKRSRSVMAAPAKPAAAKPAAKPKAKKAPAKKAARKTAKSV